MSKHSAKVEIMVNEVLDLKNLKQADFAKKYFRAQNDKFLGVSVPNLRIIAKRSFHDLNLDQAKELLKSEYHEIRLLGVICLVYQFETARKQDYKNLMELIFDFYLDNLEYVDNWDLVDISCKAIVGQQLLITGEYEILNELAKSSNLWSRRVAVVSTYYLIINKIFEPVLKICEFLLTDKEPLIQKAVGWMLREVGKQDNQVLNEFLIEHKSKLARTTLRYAIEKHSLADRQKFMA